jgi:hypothetical protein
MPNSIEPTTLAGTIELLRGRGYAASFEASHQGLRVAGREKIYRAEELSIRESYRFEGVSDPDDLAVAYAIEASDGTRGVLVDAFGPYANPAVAQVLSGIHVRSTGPRPGAAAA